MLIFLGVTIIVFLALMIEDNINNRKLYKQGLRLEKDFEDLNGKK
jgi:hypothetical protein